jgi:predicted MFS family arabinose efflux permease
VLRQWLAARGRDDGGVIAELGSTRPALRTRAWGIVGALSVTEMVSWGILYYAFAVFLLPMQRELGYSAAQLTGAFSLALLVSAVAGIAVGRHLDRRSPRRVMTLGSVAGVLLVLAWSQVQGLAAFYTLWVGIGLVMAAVLYEPAFTVLAKWFPESGARRRAMTAMTLAGALASFIFLPLAQVLIDAYGWRDALIVLALVLAIVTVPLHAVTLRQAPPAPTPRRAVTPVASARDALRSQSFWLLSGAFFLATGAAIAFTVQGIPFLLERGYSPSFAAFSIGVIGVSQIPGRLLFAPVAERLPAPWGTVALFVLIAAGIGLIVGVDATAAVIAGLILLGIGNGMATLARATVIADRYGAAAYGTIASVAASATIGARAAAPVAAAAYAAVVGYSALLVTLGAVAVLAAALAYAAERRGGEAIA